MVRRPHRLVIALLALTACTSSNDTEELGSDWEAEYIARSNALWETYPDDAKSGACTAYEQRVEDGYDPENPDPDASLWYPADIEFAMEESGWETRAQLDQMNERLIQIDWELLQAACIPP